MNRMIFVVILVVLVYIPIGIKGCSTVMHIEEKVQARRDYYDNLYVESRK